MGIALASPAISVVNELRVTGPSIVILVRVSRLDLTQLLPPPQPTSIHLFLNLTTSSLFTTLPHRRHPPLLPRLVYLDFLRRSYLTIQATKATDSQDPDHSLEAVFFSFCWTQSEIGSHLPQDFLSFGFHFCHA